MRPMTRRKLTRARRGGRERLSNSWGPRPAGIQQRGCRCTNDWKQRPWIACQSITGLCTPMCKQACMCFCVIRGRVWRLINSSGCTPSCIERLQLHNGGAMGVTISGIKEGEWIQKRTGSTASLAQSAPRLLLNTVEGKPWLSSMSRCLETLSGVIFIWKINVKLYF